VPFMQILTIERIQHRVRPKTVTQRLNADSLSTVSGAGNNTIRLADT